MWGGEEGKCVDCVARQAGHCSAEELLSRSDVFVDNCYHIW